MTDLQQEFERVKASLHFLPALSTQVPVSAKLFAALAEKSAQCNMQSLQVHELLAAVKQWETSNDPSLVHAAHVVRSAFAPVPLNS